jgi:hypothetical protein
MKKLLLALLAVGGFASANAQKDSWLIYGNAGYATSTVDYGAYDYRTTAWGINPGVGYQFSNHMTIGLQGGYNNMRTPASDGINTEINKDWSVGGFWRYTHYVGNIFFIFNQMELSYMQGSVQTDGLNNKSTYNGITGAWYPAIGAFVYKGLAMNFNIGGVGFASYNGNNASVNSPDVNGSAFAITFGRTVNIGISKNISCHKGHGRHHGGNHEPGAEVRRMKIVEDDEEASDDDYSAKKARLKAKREKQKVRIKSGDDDE